MQMSVPVEARSLSSLTTLFANPPQYPRNPTHELHQPLVLYIVRVPGNKDVFLTPLKPPTKTSISPEAIQSCLYYLHVVTPEDEVLRKSLDEQKPQNETPARTHSIQRKPLPDVPFANYPPSNRPPLPPKSYPHFQPSLSADGSDTQNARYSSRGTHLRLHTNEGHSGVQRKPLGPRDFGAKQDTESDAAVKRKPTTNWRDDSSIGETRRAENTRLNSSPKAFQDHGSSRIQPGVEEHFTSLQQSVTEITLIRRDPASGAQWNIGTIRFPGPNAQTVTSGAEKSVTVELSTPGYQKFARNGDDLGGRFLRTASDIKSLIEAQVTSSPISTVNEPKRDLLFSRDVQMQTRQDSLEGPHTKRMSTEVLSSLGQGLNSSPRQKLRPKFGFKSPWQGSCSFSTGMDGRSLKCRHTLSSIANAENGWSAEVAELRSNLPWLKSMSKDPDVARRLEGGNRFSHAGRDNKESFKKRLKHLKNKSWNGGSSENSDLTAGLGLGSRPRSQAWEEDDISNDEDRMDLRLGREKAGGGFQGRSAKLGKLIIEDEGLKMCDLVVGACMGIWWQQYLDTIDDPA